MLVSEMLVREVGYLTENERKAMVLMARDIPFGGVFVNIGVGVGTSSLAVAEANQMIQCYSVDINQDSFDTEVSNFALASIKPPIQLLGDSGKLGWAWKGGMINFLFIDGDHSESGLTRDMIGWLQHVAPGGIVAYHDYKSKMWGAIASLIDEAMKPHMFIFQIDTLIAFRMVRE